MGITLSSSLRSALRRLRPAPSELKQNFTDLLFETGLRSASPETLTGPMRVAYGPLVAAPVLKRPVVLLPGFSMAASSYDRMARHLASQPANGAVVVYDLRAGAFLIGGKPATAEQVKRAKIFEVQYRDTRDAPSVKARMAVLDAISAALGQKKLDVVAHSAGNNDFLTYLATRRGSQVEIGNVVMLGSTVRGTFIANVAEHLGKPLKFDVASEELALRSPAVAQLERDWPKLRAQMDSAMVIAVTGAPTVTSDGRISTQGDGYVTDSDMGLPGARLVSLKGPHHTPLAHLWVPQYSGVINETMRALGG
jgi:pimeloyl-ACP methyl ester carboxylesterase